jgi:hypothetical protein
MAVAIVLFGLYLKIPLGKAFGNPFLSAKQKVLAIARIFYVQHRTEIGFV